MKPRPAADVARTIIFAGLAFIGLSAYAVRLGLSLNEIARVLLGLTALWGPLAAFVYVLVRREVARFVPRLAFSLAASYGLTTLLYFACCVVSSPNLFYVFQCLFAVAAMGFMVRNRRQTAAAWVPRIDWTLIFLIILTLLLFARYQVPYREDSIPGSVQFVTGTDQTYFIGQVHELALHTPPVEQACQSGVPERAYHLLPHLAAMLTARFCGQSDLMRAHLLYHYAWITVLLCLLFHGIAETLARSRFAGYVAVCSVVIFAVPFPPIGYASLSYIYFNLFPQATTLFEPTVFTSPQMYSGFAVTFGAILGMVLLARQLIGGAGGRRRGFTAVAVVTAVMVAATSRFRVQVFLVLAPTYIAFLAFFFLNNRRSRPTLAGALVLTLVLSGLLFIETRSPRYLAGTAGVRISYAPSYPVFLDNWPLAQPIRVAIKPYFGKAAYDRVWPTISTLGFTIFNGIGLPILLATIYCADPRGNRRPSSKIYPAVSLPLVFGSLIGSQFIQSTADPYSVGGQMLLHMGWYLLPFLPLAVWDIARRVARRFPARRAALAALAIAAVAGVVVFQFLRPPSEQERMNRQSGICIASNDWLSLEYLRDHTPSDAVVLSDHHMEGYAAVYPGIACRSAYLSYTIGTPQDVVGGAGSSRPRLEIIPELWSTRSPRHFMELLEGSNVTHVVEFSDSPLSMGPCEFLRPIWESPPGVPRVRIFQYLPQLWSDGDAPTTDPTKGRNPS